jgi:hypothetical protein
MTEPVRLAKSVADQRVETDPRAEGQTSPRPRPSPCCCASRPAIARGKMACRATKPHPNSSAPPPCGPKSAPASPAEKAFLPADLVCAARNRRRRHRRLHPALACGAQAPRTPLGQREIVINAQAPVVGIVVVLAREAVWDCDTAALGEADQGLAEKPAASITPHRVSCLKCLQRRICGGEGDLRAARVNDGATFSSLLFTFA